MIEHPSACDCGYVVYNSAYDCGHVTLCFEKFGPFRAISGQRSSLYDKLSPGAQKTNTFKMKIYPYLLHTPFRSEMFTWVIKRFTWPENESKTAVGHYADEFKAECFSAACSICVSD